jgi:miniconductance mechanosensitive channel
MNTWLNQVLIQLGISTPYIPLVSQLVGVIAIMMICATSYYLAKHQLFGLLQKMIVASRNTWDDLLIEHKVLSRIAWLLPLLMLLLLAPQLFIANSVIAVAAETVAKIAISLQIANIISSLLNVLKSVIGHSSAKRYLPINATIQVIKLLVYLVASILAISFLLDRSPLYLLSGLGALTAVLLLVFQDTIKGFVASIQISANKMVAPGDWIEMPKYGADGDVIEIALNTVKVKNFDNTVTTIPTYALISESFKNWRGMFNSDGRRIKRAIMFDVNSVHFCTEQELLTFGQINLLSHYLAQKQLSVNADNQHKGIAERDSLNARQLTNLGTFRAYIEGYLHQHPKIQQHMTCMVRQLPATAEGLPLELYCFSNDQVWKNYEQIQADIFDHLFAMASNFNLRVFQHPTGHDFQKFVL